MIPSAKSQWFTRWFAGQARARLRRGFGAMQVAGAEHLRRALAEGPVLVVSNHSAWWDPLVLLVLTTFVVPADTYALMDASNLRRLPFFAKAGAFGVDRQSRRDGAEAMRYAMSQLDRPGRLVWVFPQGQERPLHERPLAFFGGTARIAARAEGVRVMPVAIAYAFGAAAQPEVFVSIGERLGPASSVASARTAQEQAVQGELERIDRELQQRGSQGFEPHLVTRPGWGQGLAERALAWLARPFVPGVDALGEGTPSPALGPATAEPQAEPNSR